MQYVRYLSCTCNNEKANYTLSANKTAGVINAHCLKKSMHGRFMLMHIFEKKITHDDYVLDECRYGVFKVDEVNRGKCLLVKYWMYTVNIYMCSILKWCVSVKGL